MPEVRARVRVLRVELPRPYARDERFAISLAFGGRPTNVTGGLYWVQGGAATYAQPIGARNWYACKDRPSDKAQYEGFVTVPKAYTVASNGVLVGVSGEGRTRTFHWREDHQIATYLVSLAIAKYVSFEGSARGIPLVHYVPTQDAAATTIPESEAKPGDLVVYDNEDHVGIYLGQGLVLGLERVQGQLHVLGADADPHRPLRRGRRRCRRRPGRSSTC